MKPIEGIDPAELVVSASTELLIEQRKEGVQRLKKLFAAIYDLGSVDIPKLEKELDKKKKQLASKESILAKFKAGDWTALNDEQQNQGEKI